MKLSDLIAEIKSASYEVEQIGEELLITPYGYDDEIGAVGINNGSLYYRIAPSAWFSTIKQKETRDSLLGFLKLLMEVHQQKIFTL